MSTSLRSKPQGYLPFGHIRMPIDDLSKLIGGLCIQEILFPPARVTFIIVPQHCSSQSLGLGTKSETNILIVVLHASPLSLVMNLATFPSKYLRSLLDIDVWNVCKSTHFSSL